MEMKLILIGLFSGIISGMGIGGGVLLIPFLVLFNDVSQIDAQGVNLVVFIPVAIIALLTHRKEGNLESKYNKKRIIQKRIKIWNNLKSEIPRLRLE